MKTIVAAGAALAALAFGVAHAQSRDNLNMSGMKENNMALCPSAVAGAKTEVTDLPDGVEVRVTATDEAAQAEIRRRAQKQAEISMLAERGSIEHTGLGTGSGRFGFCPGLVQQTRLQEFDLPDGARMVIKPFEAHELDRLRKLTHQRADALREAALPKHSRKK